MFPQLFQPYPILVFYQNQPLFSQACWQAFPLTRASSVATPMYSAGGKHHQIVNSKKCHSNLPSSWSLLNIFSSLIGIIISTFCMKEK
jgi:hypothetical protein